MKKWSEEKATRRGRLREAMTMRYEKKGDVVVDHQTGIIWQEDYAGPMDWYEAMTYPASRGVGWRLPTVHELFGTIDHGLYSPASTFPGMSEKQFWSSSSYAGSSSYAWSIDFGGGTVGVDHRAYDNYVRCVRGGPWD